MPPAPRSWPRVLLALLAVCVVVGGAAAIYLRPEPEMPIAAIGGATDLDGVIPGITPWLQGDPAWGREPIGGSGEPMASVGCTITSTAMALQTLGHTLTPLELLRGLKQNAGFTPQGLIIWSALGPVTQNAVQVRFPPLSHESIDDALRRRKPVITRILLGGQIPHWVLTVGKQGPAYLAYDPLNEAGVPVQVSDLSSRIYAIRVLEPS